MDGPLTTDQEMLYEKVERSGASSARFMHVAKCVRLSGAAIDTDCFERAARCLVARNPILRSRLYFTDGRLRQRQDGDGYSFEVFDVVDDDQAADAVLSAQADKPLDLFHDNPFKIVLARTGSDADYVMLLGHHIFLDDISMEQLLATYIGLVLNPAGADETLVRDAGEHGFLAWCERQQRLIHDDTFARKTGYWLGRLADADPLLHVPGRPDNPGFQTVGSNRFALDPDAVRIFHNRVRRLGVTPFALAASAVFSALRAVTGEDDNIFSAVTDTRRAPFMGTIGQFASLFPFRHRIRGAGLADEDVRDVHRELLTAIKYYISPPLYCDQLDWLDERRAKKFYMTDVCVNYLPMKKDLNESIAWSGHKVSPLPLTARAKPPRSPYYGMVMDFFFIPEPDGLSVVVQHETALVSSQVASDVTASLRDGLSADA